MKGLETSYPIQSNDVIVALGGVEFDRKSSRVARRVREFSTKGDGAESNEDWCFLTRLLKEVCLAIWLVNFCPVALNYARLDMTYVKSPMDFVTSKCPKAPEPHGCTIPKAN